MISSVCKKGILTDLAHFLIRARDSGDWQKETITEEEFRKLLKERIETVNMQKVKEDARRFYCRSQKLDIWSDAYFRRTSQRN